LRQRRNFGGFTLVELAASVAVASVALAATAAAVTSGASLARTTEETRMASRAATSMMERVRSTPFDQIVTTFNGTTQSLQSLTVSDSSGSAVVGVVDVSDPGASWKVLQVTVTASWKGVNGNVNRKFVTFVSDRRSGTQASSTTLPADGVY
jgi:prepilin-type N-terminal cleavage/methylation domain-containing protein